MTEPARRRLVHGPQPSRGPAQATRFRCPRGSGGGAMGGSDARCACRVRGPRRRAVGTGRRTGGATPYGDARGAVEVWADRRRTPQR